MGKGIFDQINNKGKVDKDNSYFDAEKMKSRLREIVEKEHRNSCKPRSMWAGLSFLKAMRRGRTDREFYSMLQDVEIITTVRGARFIENFIENYKKKLLLEDNYEGQKQNN